MRNMCKSDVRFVAYLHQRIEEEGKARRVEHPYLHSPNTPDILGVLLSVRNAWVNTHKTWAEFVKLFPGTV